MTERIVILVDGVLVDKGVDRDPSKHYSDLGTGPDGEVILREWSDEESFDRAFEEAAHEDGIRFPPPPDTPSPIEELAEIKAKISDLEKVLTE